MVAGRVLWVLVAIGCAIGGAVAVGYVLVPGSTDRRKVRAVGVGRAVRWVRSRAARVACAVAAWPHVVDVLRRVDRYAPRGAPSALVAASGPARLHRYAGEPRGAPVLVVHSVISSSSVLDLTPDVSLIQALLASGRDVWLLDWDFGSTPPDAGLGALAQEVAWAAALVRSDTEATRVPVVAYCLGATLALLREATERSGDPLVVVAPVVDTTADLARGVGMGQVLAHPWLHPTLALDERGFVPGAVVREAFHWLRPKALRTVRGWTEAKASPELAAGYAAMARWVWDHQPLPGGVLLDAVAMFRAGGLHRITHLGDVRVPVLVVCATRDHIVPTMSSTALVDLLGGPVEVVEIDAGHVGMLVSLGSGDLLRPELLAWLDAR